MAQSCKGAGPVISVARRRKGTLSKLNSSNNLSLHQWTSFRLCEDLPTKLNLNILRFYYQYHGLLNSAQTLRPGKKNMFISLFYFTRKSHWHHISSFEPLLRKEPLTTIQPNSIQKSKYILLVLVISPDKFSTIFVVVVIIIIRVFPAYKKFLFYPQCKRKIPRNVVHVGVIWIKWS